MDDAETLVATAILRRETPAPGVLRLVLADPARRNTLSEAMLAALTDAVARAGRDPAVKVVILAAEGRAFSAGHDLKELTARRADPDGGRAYFTEIMARCAALMTALVRLPKPVVAEVAGVATAAGCQLVASCDLAVASEEARFATPGMHIGLFCSTPMVALSRNVAPKHAMEMLLDGDPVDAATAHRFGLVNRVVPAGRLAAVTLAWATKIAGRSGATLSLGKAAFYRQIEAGLEAAYRDTAAVMVENMLARDAAEGIDAFLARRPPRWAD